MSGELIPAARMKDIVKLDDTVKQSRTEIAKAKQDGNEMLVAFTIASSMQRLREAITPDMMKDIMSLKGSPLGFKTDERQGVSYSVDQVRDNVIVALADGARLVGNEFNIIASNYYRTLPQFERRIKECEGLTQFKMEIGVPHVKDEGALCSMYATWKFNGHIGELRCEKTDTLDTRIPVKVNRGMGLDAILGKAKRKFLARVMDRIAGTSYESEIDEETDVVDSVVVSQRTTAANGKTLREVMSENIDAEPLTDEEKAEIKSGELFDKGPASE